jgi:UDP:flavonoid glycosyltransferase YjiC (YdhE family)
VGHDALPVAALNVFADLDIELVATLIPRPGTKPVVADNIRVVDFVPLHALLPTCSAVIHFGGGGTWSTAMVNAVPQLVFARVWDSVVAGEHLERSGAGIFLDSPELNIPDLRKGLGRLLDEPSFAESARRLRDELLAEPTPASLVPTLEKLVADYRT